MGHRSPLARARRPRVRSRQGMAVSEQVTGIPGPIILATDASVGARHVSIGYVATPGHAGLRAHLYPAHLTAAGTRVVVTELRAVYWGLKPVLAAHPGRPVEIRVDSLDALRHLHAWQDGDTRMPQGYDSGVRANDSPPSLHQRQMLAEYTPNLTFVHEKAHAGNPLNETADSLAKLGLRAVSGKAAGADIPRLLALWAAGGLEAYRRGRAESARVGPK